MLGYNEMANQKHNLGDPFKGCCNKFRPLIPRPHLSPPNPNVQNPTNHLLSLNTTAAHNHHHHHNHFGEVMGSEEGKAEVVGTHQVMVSSRWNPTLEQLSALEELYRHGTRTPSAEQIQHITSQLRRYGKIEGKNVFYWFQNHKARERQKRRRQLQLNSSEKGGNKDNGDETIELKSCKWVPSSTNKESDPTPETTGVTKAAQTTTTSSIIPPQFQHNNHQTNNHYHNINNIKNLLLFSGEWNSTWHAQSNNTMVQKNNTTCSCCCYYPSLVTHSLSSSKLIDSVSSPSVIMPETPSELGVNKPVLNDGNDNEDVQTPPPPQSPTLQLFPIAQVREHDHHDNHHHEHNFKDDNNNEKTNVNNPFPYYHFL